MIEPYIWLKCLETLEWKKDTWKHPGLWVYLGYYLLTLVKQYVTLYMKNNKLGSVFMAIMIFYMFGVIVLLFKGTVQKKIATLGIFWTVGELCDVFAVMSFSKVLHISINTVLQFSMLNNICTLFSKIVLLGICFFIYLNKKKKLINWFNKDRKLFPVIFVLSIFVIIISVIIYSWNCQEKDKSIIMIAFSAELIVLFAIGYFSLIYRQSREELAEKDAVIESSTSLEDLKHDLPFHARMLTELAACEDQTEMREYIRNIVGDVEIAEDTFHLKNYFVSKVLSQLAIDARKKNIPFTHFIAVEDFVMKNNEIASVLSNILKNAIEAAEKVPLDRRFIELEIRPISGGYKINCTNSYLEKPEFKDGKWETTKVDKQNHGRGIGIIRRTVDKYSGIVKVQFHERSYEIECIIRDKRER